MKILPSGVMEARCFCPFLELLQALICPHVWLKIQAGINTVCTQMQGKINFRDVHFQFLNGTSWSVGVHARAETLLLQCILLVGL